MLEDLGVPNVKKKYSLPSNMRLSGKELKIKKLGLIKTWSAPALD
jgi:hypothetical protein